ncbi:hypothetical protein [Streptomyces sp. NPDC056660]|uniref:hypothetical protein n=1 Tax=Streptomyces sp. NPDC056660 TaxID=3345897 RepID=UPI0036BD7B9A
MVNIAKLSPHAVQPTMSALLSIGYTDFALRELGATRNRLPSSYGDNWIDHLGWGTDSAYSAARLIFSGQLLGATTILRSQFERWAENAAYNTGVTHRNGESAASFMGRAWAKCHDNFPFAPPAIRESRAHGNEAEHDSWEEESVNRSPQGPSVLIGRDHRVYPTHLMDDMSDLLHGRGSWIDVVHWEAGQLLDGPPPSILRECVDELSDVLTLNLRQVRLCLATLAEEKGHEQLPQKILSSSFERANAGDAPPKFPALIPLLPNAGLRPEVVAGLEDAAEAHDGVLRGRRPAGRLYRDDEFAHLHFYERRRRAAMWALKAFEFEKERTGNLDFSHLTNRDFRYMIAAEMAGLISVWLKGTPAGDAAASCSSALRSAYWMWLEDDDRALAALRVLLEQCARLRVWTEKPEKAEKLEKSLATTPKDWLNSAGWRRLSALNKALGEFSHAHANIRQNGAREILQKIQSGDVDPEDSIYLARGHALDALTILLISESIGSASKISSSIGASFLEIVDDVLMDKGKLTESTEDLFNRTMTQKGTPLGDYSFKGPADAIRADRVKAKED